MRSSKERGAALVEMALVLPVFVLLIFGMVEFSVALYDKAMITNASREGARAGIVFKTPPVTDGEITTVVNNYLAGHMITFTEGSSAQTTVIRAGTLPGSELRVRVTYNYGFLVLPRFIGGNSGLNMVAQTSMRLE